MADAVLLPDHGRDEGGVGLVGPMKVYAWLAVLAPVTIAALFLFGDIMLAAWRTAHDRRNGWTCACGERFASREAGPAPFHRLDHG